MTWRERLSDVWHNPGKYSKAIVAVLGTIAVVVVAISNAIQLGWGDGHWDSSDTVYVLVAVATALGVYGKSNRT